MKSSKRNRIAIVLIAIMVIITACNVEVTMPDGTVTEIPYAAWLRTQEAEDAMNTQIAIMQSWTPTPTLTPTPTDTPTPTPTPTATALGGYLGVCKVYDWNTWQELSDRQYPEGVMPACSDTTLECVGVHIRCFQNGVEFAQFGKPVEQRLVEIVEPNKRVLSTIFIAFGVLVLLIFLLPAMKLLSPFFRALENAVPEGRPARESSKRESHKALELSRNSSPSPSNPVKYTLGAFVEMLAGWDQDISEDFYRWLMRNPAYKSLYTNRRFLTADHCANMLVEYNQVQAELFLDWQRQQIRHTKRS